MRGSDSRAAMFDWFIGDGKLPQIVSHHLRLCVCVCVCVCVCGGGGGEDRILCMNFNCAQWYSPLKMTTAVYRVGSK